MEKVRICISAYLNDDTTRVNSLYCCVYSLLAQTYENIEIFIHHDGPVNDKTLKEKFESISNKIKFIDNLPHKKDFGHHHRRPTSLIEPTADWIVFTNDDNYYVRKFVEIMLNTAYYNDADMVYCDMVHTDINTPIPRYMQVSPVPCWIDMGCFMTKTDIIKKVEWTDFSGGADGIYAEKISKVSTAVKAPGVLFVHN